MTAMGIRQFPPWLTCLYNVRDQTYAALPHVPLNDHAPKSESEIWVWAKKNTLCANLVLNGYWAQKVVVSVSAKTCLSGTFDQPIRTGFCIMKHYPKLLDYIITGTFQRRQPVSCYALKTPRILSCELREMLTKGVTEYRSLPRQGHSVGKRTSWCKTLQRNWKINCLYRRYRCGRHYTENSRKVLNRSVDSAGKLCKF